MCQIWIEAEIIFGCQFCCMRRCLSQYFYNLNLKCTLRVVKLPKEIGNRIFRNQIFTKAQSRKSSYTRDAPNDKSKYFMYYKYLKLFIYTLKQKYSTSVTNLEHFYYFQFQKHNRSTLSLILYYLCMIPKTQVTIIPKKFMYLADVNPPKDVPKAFFFNIDNDLVYEGFFEDFGPLNLAKIWKYIMEVQKFLTDKKYSENVFYHFTSPHFAKCTNSALLVCAYLVVVEKRTPQEAFEPFRHIEFRPFRDAGYGQCSYKCTILDCLRGLYYAIRLGWFDYRKWDIAEYEHYEKIQNGDLNWIVPGKLLAFSSPYDSGKDDSGNLLFTPKEYIPIFKKLGVTAVVRLNNQTYNSAHFKEAGIHHHELFFTDGTCPPKEIVERFLEIAQGESGAVAVHCKAGLGRTGTLISCYAIKHYHFNAADFIGWIRLCRPGSVLGPQQYFLLQMEQALKQQGQASPLWKSVRSLLSEEQVTRQMKSLSIKGKMNEQEKLVMAKGDLGQGGKLMQAKKRHDLKKPK